jgi:hypothetical protein
MSLKEIIKECQKAIERAAITDIQLRGISKSASGMRIQCQTEEQIKQLRTIDWNETFEGMRIHKSKYGILIRGISRELDLDNEKTIKEIESNNGFAKGTILEITPLRRKNNESTNQSHQSIIIYLNNPHTANNCMKTDVTSIISIIAHNALIRNPE